MFSLLFGLSYVAAAAAFVFVTLSLGEHGVDSADHVPSNSPIRSKWTPVAS